jgi:hypothetical protein
MIKKHVPIAFAALLAGAIAHADVTIQEQTTLNLSVIKAHISSTKRITDDKKRTESQFTCDGFMSMLCGKNDSLEIVRLDQSVTRHGDAKKKTYTETPFPTPEERQAIEQHMKEVMEKMKSCPTPVADNSPKVDTSKCEMTPPTTNVVNTTDTATIAGHAAHHSILTMTQSCANKDTGDSCDMAYTFDLWLANDDLPELASRQSFDKNYVHKLGLDEPGGVALPATLTQFMAPYKDAMQKLGSESSALKGYPLKSTFRFAFGGPHCASAKGGGGSQSASSGGSSGGLVSDAGGAAAGAAASSSQSAADAEAAQAISHSTGSGVGGYIAGSAAGAFANKMIGGLFSKKKTADASPPKDATAAAAAAPAAPAAPGMLTVAEMTVETTAINATAVPADQFEMPADWKRVMPKEREATEPTCPKAGG